MRRALQNHLDHRVRRQRAVNLVKLFAAGGVDGEGHAQVITPLAGTQLHCAGVKAGIKLLGDVGDGAHQMRVLETHHLDRKGTRVSDE